MKLVNVGSEISSTLKWNAVLLILNGGLLLVVFSQMTTVNHCDKNITEAFFYPGAFAVLIGLIGLFFAVITEFVIPLCVRLWRWFDE
jgi:hypothetical protein